MSRFPSLFDDLAHDHLRQASVSSSSTSSSRNDLFSLSFEPPLPPPSPVVAGQAASTSNSAANSPILSPRTSSFFDSGSLGTPSPAPRLPPPASSGTSSASRINSTPSFAPSPLSLSRASSRHRKPPPPGVNTHIAGPHEPLSPLHQSPSLSTEELSSWRPPLPAATDEVSLRFSIAPTYMLGEGRYAQVFLAAYKRQSEASSRDETEKETSKTDKEPSINELGDGLTGGSWRLCAAKRMAPDRQSQTMGLREAFFLNRLTGANGPSSHGVRRPRVRDCSPLRYQHDVPITPKRNGSVYIVKLIAVKEDADSTKAYSHSRSSSDALTQAPPKRLNRQRSSTFGMPEGTLSPSASLPALAQAARAAQTPPSVSRLILLLEHAPMGTMDRLLRTSPGLVGKNLWERWARQGASALAWVHEKGVVHADVKPGNLLLTMDLQLRLSDFGSSLLIHPAHPPTDGVGLGTLPFSPPELVDPTRCFSFPVDIFALGATLYQCITGREPFRGCRTIEMMHHVRRGGLWAYEERTRLGKIGSEQPSNAGSPYPSAWRELGINQEGVKRGGSLRVPGGGGDRPRLTRMSSAESLKASEDLVRSETGIDSPAGVKLWAKWMKQPSSVNDAMAALLTEHNHETGRGLVPIRNGPTRRSIDGTSPTSPTIAESTNEAETVPSLGVPLYPDGTPCMLFLDGETMVDIQVREILKEMLDPDPEARPTAAEILRSWDEMGIDHVEEAL